MEESKQKQPATKSEPKPKIHTQKFKPFQLVETNCAYIGISLNSVAQPFNWKILLGFLVLSVTIVCQLVYFFNDARTYAEYTQSIYTCSLVSATFLTMLILILKRATLCEFIKHLDETINTGK